MMTKSVPDLIVLVLAALVVGAAAAAAMPDVTWATTGAQASKPTVALSPTTAVPNLSITVTGQNFSTGGTIASITVGGISVPGENINFGSPVHVDTAGNFVASLLIPFNPTTLKAGSYPIKVTDSAGASASASLTIPKASLSVSPASSRVGSAITVTGTNFPAGGESVGAGGPVTVTIEYQVKGGDSRKVATAWPDSSGRFTTTFDVPWNTPISSQGNTVQALVNGLPSEATGEHSVPSPTLGISPTTGPPGTRVNVTGKNFRAFSPVTSVSVGGLEVAASPNLFTDVTGGFVTSFVVPDVYAGAQPVSVVVDTYRHTGVFHLAAPPTPKPRPLPRAVNVADALHPLGDSLVRVFYFDNATQSWGFYDPRPEFVGTATLTELEEGQPYLIKVNADQSAFIEGRVRSFNEGWNLMVW